MNEQELQNIPLFAPLSIENRQEIALVLHPKRLSPGEVLIREGETGDCVYVIVSGELEVTQAADTSTHVLHTVGAGALLGEMSIFDQAHARTATVRALTDVALLEMTHDDFEQLLHRRPELAAELVREMSTRLLQSNASTIQHLTAKNRELAEAYEALKAAQAQIIEKETLERELVRAREIQRSFLPRAMPQLAGFDFGALMTPARSVGGDFYDFIQLDEHRLGMVIADVSGKGMPAALFMALTCSMIRAEAHRWKHPVDVLAAVNRQMIEVNQAGMFVTMIYGVLNGSTNQLHYARAGHNIPILVEQKADARMLDFEKGQALGLFGNPVFDPQTVELSPGSLLILYTDGVTDAINEEQEDYGEERLLASLSAPLPASAQEACAYLSAEAAAFQGTAPQFDDFTVVAVRSS